jgi:2,3-bisphosphoglycerate-independent phosphoglycerate mutase
MALSNLGEGFRHMEKRFRVTYNKQTGTWRLLDTWHDAMQKISDWTAEVADDNPAMTIVTDDGFETMAMEAARLGILGKAVMPVDNTAEVDACKETIKKQVTEIEEYQKEQKAMQDRIREEIQKNASLVLEASKTKQVPPRSERYELKQQVVKGLLQLAGMEDLREIDQK